MLTSNATKALQVDGHDI
jgi:hypothetical protein